MLDQSILLQKAGKGTYNAVYQEPISNQIKAYKTTIIDLEECLDTGDLSQLTTQSLEVIKNDLLWIIRGFRKAKRNQLAIFDWVNSVDQILENLRKSRDVIFIVDGMFSEGELIDDKREDFFPKMRKCRECLANALDAFQ